jgi:nicotinamide-nucleotide amidase
MNAEIITIGDEILIGQVIDTNSAFLATELNKLGISVVQITSVPDTREGIVKALDAAISRAGLILITGGLGPTSDDITKPALTEYFNTRLVENPVVVEKIRSILASRGVKMTERNRKMAELPADCEILNNSAGSAQGMWFVKDGKHFISLPGVPFEMKAIYLEEIEYRLKERFSLPNIHHTTILTHGMPESMMANLIQEWEENLPSFIKLAYLPSPGILRLRLSGKSTGPKEELIMQMEVEKGKLEDIIRKYIFGYGVDTLEQLIGKVLREKNMTLALAESCTGGTLSSMITSVAGASAYYRGGIISYANEIKTSELNVSPYTLMINGAVSQAVVEQMAEGVRVRYQTDFAVATSGIAGPDGGSPEKPVGTTWIAVASKNKIISSLHNFADDRGRNIQKAAITALFMLWNEVKDCL